MRRSAAEILREYGPFPGADHVHGVTFDGQHVWFATGDKLNAFDPASGKVLRSIDVAAHAGTAFDGEHLFQIAEDRIQKIDPKTGRVLATIPAPGGGGDSGLAWAEGTLWVGQHRGRKIHQIDPQTGAILRTIVSNRVVTGVTWIDGELWHGTWEDDESDVRRVDPRTGEVLERLEMPPGVGVSGSSPTAATTSSAEEEGAERCEPCAGPGEAPRPAAAPRLDVPQVHALLAVSEEPEIATNILAKRLEGFARSASRDIERNAMNRIARSEWQRRILVRWEYHPQNFLGFVQLACLVILFRRF
jgi:hypothetical protein